MTEWISVKDRLPEECVDVLIFNSNHIPVVGFLTYLNKNEPINWTVCDWHDSELTVEVDYVTHWMPLPKLPEEK